MPNSDKSKKIGKATGGFTVTADLPATLLRANGQPGPGTDVTTYIDITNNDGKGYKSKKKRNRGVPFPMWIILAHELTTGHATRMTSGEVPSINGERPDEQAEEELAKRSEDPHRDAHGDSSRHR